MVTRFNMGLVMYDGALYRSLAEAARFEPFPGGVQNVNPWSRPKDSEEWAEFRADWFKGTQPRSVADSTRGPLGTRRFEEKKTPSADVAAHDET